MRRCLFVMPLLVALLMLGLIGTVAAKVERTDYTFQWPLSGSPDVVCEGTRYVQTNPGGDGRPPRLTDRERCIEFQATFPPGVHIFDPYNNTLVVSEPRTWKSDYDGTEAFFAWVVVVHRGDGTAILNIMAYYQ